MDEALWARAVAIEDFQQLRPTPGAAPSERTRIYITYDDEAIYVGARMLRADPSSIPRMMSRRDGQANAEKITIVFDPQMDRRTGVGFGVSSAGVRSDFRHTQDEEMRGRESQFDPVWAAARTSTPPAGRRRCGSRSRSCASPRATCSAGACR
jgi:hypothetical protein